MVFHLRQIGKLKLFNRKKPAGTSQENLGSENKAAENPLSSNLDNQGIALGISGADMQAPIKNVSCFRKLPA